MLQCDDDAPAKILYPNYYGKRVYDSVGVCTEQ